MSDRTDSNSDDGGEMTLAFDLAALTEVANPQHVVADARRWSRHVGVVGDDAHAVASYVQRHDFTQDFELGDLDKRSVLSKLKWEADTDRYVFVGTGPKNRALANHVGWEYLSIEDAAGKADWTLAEDAGILDRARTGLARLSLWPFWTCY